MSNPSLTTPNNRWTFSTQGGRLTRWESRDPVNDEWRTICDADLSLPPSVDKFRGSTLFPWCNRIAGESYLIPDESGKLTQSVPIDTKSEFGHLHGGSIVDATWKLLHVTEGSEVAFQYEIQPSEHYPHAMCCIVRYQVIGLGEPVDATMEEEDEEFEMDLEEAKKLLNEDANIPSFFKLDDSLMATPQNVSTETLVEGLRIEIQVDNLEKSKESWVGVGSHLYFQNPFGGPIDEMSMAVRATGEIQVDEETLIPYHPLEIETPLPLEHDFDGVLPRPLGPTEFDHCFVLDEEVPEMEEGASLALLQKDHFSLEIIPEKHPADQKAGPLGQTHFMQVYTHPDRSCIALEPQTSVANHFSHPYDPRYRNCLLKPAASLYFSNLFIITWTY